LERILHSLERIVHPLERILHSLERIVHPLERILHPLERIVHSLERILHSLERILHPLERILHPLERIVRSRYMELNLHIMKIEILPSYEAVSMEAKNRIVEQLSLNKSLLLCAATGDSPLRTYELLAESTVHDISLFSQLRIVKLDEWGGLPMTHPGTCESFLRKHLLRPLSVTDDRYIAFRSDAASPEKECNRIQQALSAQAPVDICVLGIGMNGHIALNEPAPELQPHCHRAVLAGTSLQHPMIAGSDRPPTCGLTLGMADILQSRKIILLIGGSKKAKITKAFLSGMITTALPASFLWLHPDVVCLIEQNAFEE
jgi:galactosamine-6-phosphate isomerase